MMHADSVEPFSNRKVSDLAQQWSPPLDLDGLINCEVGFSRALAVAAFVFPVFVEIDGCVVRNGTSAQSVRDWLVATSGNVSATEAVINHLHLWDVFLNDRLAEEDVPHLEWLGECIKAGWSHQLAATFPGRSFVVEFTNDPDDYGPTVHCHSVAAPPDASTTLA